MSRPLVLVGMPGSGKSTVGRRLATRLGHPFVDADRELEERCGVSIATMFDIEGEQGFRDRETRLLDELCDRPGLVIATGGGVVLREQNRRILRDKALVLYLQASLGELWNRLRHDRKRPLLRGENPRERLADLLEQRRERYREVADLVIPCRRQPIDRSVADIIAALGAHEAQQARVQPDTGADDPSSWPGQRAP